MNPIDEYIGKPLLADNRKLLPKLPDDSVDLMTTDPQYGWGFMGSHWDKALPDPATWRECLRVLKPGAFAFVMSGPRQDCLGRMITSLEAAGFDVGFTSLYWTYATGFPKAQNMAKAIDRKLGVKGEVAREFDRTFTINKRRMERGFRPNDVKPGVIGQPASPEAVALAGSYAGYQPKPAVEVVLVAMKPLSEKTFIDQALKNGKGVTWLDGGRIPYDPDDDITEKNPHTRKKPSDEYDGRCYHRYGGTQEPFEVDGARGRFSPNLLVEDDAFGAVGDVGTKRHRATSSQPGGPGWGNITQRDGHMINYGDSGSYSRYFNLDRWWTERTKDLPETVRRTLPFIIVPKPAKSEKETGCEELYWEISKTGFLVVDKARWEGLGREEERIFRETGKRVVLRARGNIHTTVKPVKLMAYLVTIGSRPGDIVLDPFLGSGTSAIACELTRRRWIGMENDPNYHRIAVAHIAPVQNQMRLSL